jgi:hypothetical protein
MAEALLWGGVASSSLIVGGVIALRLRIAPRLLGLIMAFGAGVLISAVAYELVEEAFEASGGDGVALGLALGSLTFFAGDLLIDRLGGGDRKRSRGPQAGGTALAIVLDGIPESTVLGLTVLTGGGVSAAMADVPAIERVYVNERARRELGRQPRYDSGAAIERRAAARTTAARSRSPSARRATTPS